MGFCKVSLKVRRVEEVEDRGGWLPTGRPCVYIGETATAVVQVTAVRAKPPAGLAETLPERTLPVSVNPQIAARLLTIILMVLFGVCPIQGILFPSTLQDKKEIYMARLKLAGWAAALVLVAGAATAGAQVSDWKLDPNHSEADFSIQHMAISTVHGSFRGVTGVIHLDPANLGKSGVEASIDASTVDTGVAARDTHLKSPDFFDVAKFPTITFKSTSVSASGGDYDVAGDLTLHGVTKPVVLHLDPLGKPQADAKGNLHRGFTATTTFNRRDFGLVWGGNLSSGDPMVGDSVKIELDIEAVKS
jgi:polyisoprenoid-binding protein YceI